MTRALPRSELQLTRAQVRDLVACPTCGAPRCRSCAGDGRKVDDPARATLAPGNHAARVAAARAVLRARRLEPAE